MSRVCMHKSPYNSDTYIINEGKMLHFAYNGTFIGEKAIDTNIQNMIDVDMLSIIYDVKGVEIAYVFNNGALLKEVIATDAISLINKIGDNAKLNNLLIFCGRRTVLVSGVNVSQCLYVFRQGYLNDKIIKECLGL